MYFWKSSFIKNDKKNYFLGENFGQFKWEKDHKIDSKVWYCVIYTLKALVRRPVMFLNYGLYLEPLRLKPFGLERLRLNFR